VVVVFGGFEVLGMMSHPYAHTPYPHVVIDWCQVQKGAELPLSVTQAANTILKATVGFIRLTDPNLYVKVLSSAKSALLSDY